VAPSWHILPVLGMMKIETVLVIMVVLNLIGLTIAAFVIMRKR